MTNWVKKKIREIVYNNRPVTYGIVQPGPDIRPEGIPLIRGKDYSSGKVVLNDLYHVKPEIDLPYKRSKVKTNDVLFSIAGYVGQVAVVPEELDGANITQTTARISVDKSAYSYEYIKQFLVSEYTQTQVKQFAKGSAQQGLNLSDVEQIIVNLPDLPEQTQIAQILSKTDEIISQTEKLIAKYQRTKTGLLHELLIKGIDTNGNIRSKAGHRFVVKKGIEIPEEWEVYSIEDIAEHLGSGVTPKGGSNVYIHSGVMLIRSQNVLTGEFNFEDVAYISEEINSSMKRSRLNDLDVLLNITGASIGRSHFVPENFQAANVNQHVCAIRIKNKSIGKSIFLSSFLNSHLGQNQIKRFLGASNREGLNYQQIREIKIAMPHIENDEEFNKIKNVLQSINSYIKKVTTQYHKLLSLKTGLMQDLLIGKVRVK